MKNRRAVLFSVAVLLIVCLCIFPIPLRVHREMDAHRYSPDSAAPQPCTISMDGIRTIYLFREDQFDGTFVISDMPETIENGARLGTFLGNKSAGPMWYYTDDGILSLGYIAAPADFSWFYIYLNDDGFSGEVIAPASMSYEAMHALLEEHNYIVPSGPVL
ncbi:MAG: hypothetical protein IJE08_04600 [Clostridia bacterium]|nr:hypothetical protein [Clostridia bacterium]